ncbi:MAG: peptidylprolyl isomerase [Bacteroidota bacterium]
MTKYALFFSLMMGILLTSCGGDKTYYAVIETEFGNMKAELYNTTPKHRDNFVKLAKDGFYDDLLFHRVIDGFMIQGGDPLSRDAPAGQSLGTGGPGYLIDAEIGAPHFRGTLAAARTGGPSNPGKKSSGSQFYIVDGSNQSQQGLQAIAKQKGITYNQAQIDKYLQVGGTPMLDMDYTVFGELIDGYDVIDKIAQSPKDGANRPLKDVKMTVRITTK